MKYSVRDSFESAILPGCNRRQRRAMKAIVYGEYGTFDVLALETSGGRPKARRGAHACVLLVFMPVIVRRQRAVLSNRRLLGVALGL
jgi:hypothetical protein